MSKVDRAGKAQDAPSCRFATLTPRRRQGYPLDGGRATRWTAAGLPVLHFPALRLFVVAE